MLVGFTVSGAMAQTTWTWLSPVLIDSTIVFSDFQVDPIDGFLKGWNGTAWVQVNPIANPSGENLNFADGDISSNIVDSVAVPPFAVIDNNSVGIWDGSNGPSSQIALAEQPIAPNLLGTFKHIAAKNDGTTTTLYVIFEEDVTGDQYVLEGSAPMEWEEATVRFTPRSLNLGSNGNWVTCKVSGLTGHTWDEIELANLCIVGINDALIATPFALIPAALPTRKTRRK